MGNQTFPRSFARHKMWQISKFNKRMRFNIILFRKQITSYSYLHNIKCNYTSSLPFFIQKVYSQDICKWNDHINKISSLTLEIALKWTFFIHATTIISGYFTIDGNRWNCFVAISNAIQTRWLGCPIIKECHYFWQLICISNCWKPGKQWELKRYSGMQKI
jgi:hypothetical protein